MEQVIIWNSVPVILIPDTAGVIPFQCGFFPLKLHHPQIATVILESIPVQEVMLFFLVIGTVSFYQLRSNVPYSVSETKRSMIKSEDDVEAEIYSALGKEEGKIIAYALNEEGEFVLSAVAKDDANETFLTISLETNHD